MNLRLSSGPHIHTTHDTQDLMRTVLISLVPPAAAGIYLYGFNAALLLVISVATCVLSEYVWQRLCHKPVRIGDLSAAVTGVILALNLPSGAPWWMPVVGGVFAVILVKQLFGGIGCNFLNPAITARAVLLVSWPAYMSTYAQPERTFFTPFTDAFTGATPLRAPSVFSTLDLFLGNIPGSIGETCKFAILLGLAILLITGVVRWHVPVIFTLTVGVMTLIFSGNIQEALNAMLSGGVLFGAVYMATDYVTNPMLTAGKCIFAFGCGVIVVLIRRFGGYPEGVTFAIMMMNILTPLIDRVTKRRIFGEVKQNA